MLLALDSETSGLWRDDLDPLDPQQPNIVQLGAHLYDRQHNRRGQLTCLIKPNGWEIEAEAEAVHGISTRACHQYGIALAEALVPLRGFVACASQVVAHNMEFDRRVIAAAIHRAGGEGLWWARAKAKMLCTMEAATPVLKIPSPFGFKFPTLDEAAKGLCPGQDLPVRHDADSDIVACVAVYWALVAAGAAADPDPFARQLA